MLSVITTLVVLLWRFRQSAAVGTIDITPDHQFYGGGKTKPAITCTPSQSCPSTVRWFFEQTQIDTSLSKYTSTDDLSNNAYTLTINNANEDDQGFYHCQCTFDDVTVLSDKAEIAYINKVSFDTQNNIKYDNFTGNEVRLICNINYEQNFQWQFHNMQIIPKNTDKYQYDGTNLIIKNLTLEDSATYYCVGANEVTTIAKLGAIVEVYKRPSIVFNSSTDVSRKEGGSITFTCTVSGHPLPSLVWSKVGDELKIGGRVSKSVDTVDEYTRNSSLTISHLSAPDAGQYLCTGSNVNSTSSRTFLLSVEVPPGPFFEVFSVAKSHNNVSISWILSGVAAESINVSWTNAEGDQYHLYMKNESSVIISGLLPGSWYLITAVVVGVGVDLSDTVNVSTDALVIVSAPSISVTQTKPSPSLSFVSSIGLTTSSDRLLTTSTLQHSSTSSINRRRTTVLSETTSIPPVSRPEPSVGGSQSVNSSLTLVAPLTVSILMVVLIVSIVFALVCLVQRRRRSKIRNIQSIERVHSSRSSQVLLDSGDKILQPSGSSFVSMQSVLYHSNPSLTTHFQNFTDIEKLPPDSNGHLSNQSSHLRFPPPPYGTENAYIIDNGGDEPFEMTENPHNFDNDIEQLSMPQMSQNPQYFIEGHGFPPGDSVSQVVPPVFTSQSQNFLDPCCSSQNEAFVYMDNSFYEGVPMKRDVKSQSEPPRSSNNLPVYENHDTKPSKSPKFGIVKSGRRGDIREQVEIRK